MRTERIIAVFGGTRPPPPSEVLACAEQLGRAITDARHVLLSGGTGPDNSSVKGRAITGAGSKRWVGVVQSGPVRVEPKNGGLVIWTGLGDRRNYLEASMCDAAIALPGGDGTVSEVASALSLGRPVAFVGNWRAEVNLDASDISTVLEDMVDRTRRRFGNPTGTDGIDARLARGALLKALNPLRHYRYFEVCQAQAVVKWIESVVPGPGSFMGEFRIAGLEEEEVVRPYERWLQQHP
jgi:predicted Rossmann-fold nucleotide-binding protein